MASSSGFTSADVDLYENEPTTDSIISINELALKNIEILNNLISIDKDNQFTLLELILSPNKIKNIRIDEIKSEIRIERVYQIPLEKWQIIHNKPYNIELILPNGNILNFISENNDEELIFSSNAGKLTIVEEDKMMYLFENEDNKIYIDRDGNIDLIDNKFNTIIIERDNDELGILIYRK